VCQWFGAWFEQLSKRRTAHELLDWSRSGCHELRDANHGRAPCYARSIAISSASRMRMAVLAEP